MDSTSLVWLAAALLVVLAGVAVWRRQRRRPARSRSAPRAADDARPKRSPEAQTPRRPSKVKVKPAAALHAVATPASAGSALSEAAQRRAALEQALDAVAPAPAAGWLDTQPMEPAGDPSNDPPGFQPTQPSALVKRPSVPAGDLRR
jgi:hypothetical protein